jgi:starch phosphorylase
LEPNAVDSAFQQEFAAVKRSNKERLARLILQTTSTRVDPDSLFDVQVKRIHEYKRQLLNVLRIVHEYLCLIEDGRPPAAPRTYIFAGKAAPGYWAARQIIKLICNVGSIINNDARANGQIKVVFVPDFRVSLAEVIIPAADLSEQISTAGSEASGTGNMKLAMNGALTIGTLDGANIEMRDAVGQENIFIFGTTADQIQALRAGGSYRPRDLYQHDARLKRILDALDSTRFSPKDPGLFHWIVESILDRGDTYFHLADLPAYIEAQHQVDDVFRQPAAWASKAILNVARIGRFSSDRTIAEYARDIWGIARV